MPELSIVVRPPFSALPTDTAPVEAIVVVLRDVDVVPATDTDSESVRELPLTATMAPPILTSLVASIEESATVVVPTPGFPIETDTASSVPADAPRVTPETLVSAAPLMATVPLPVVTLPPVMDSSLSVAAISISPCSEVITEFSSRVTALSFTVIFPVASMVVGVPSSEPIVVEPVPLPTATLAPDTSTPARRVSVAPPIATSP